jgi:hypothetical protein
VTFQRDIAGDIAFVNHLVGLRAGRV